MLLHKDIHAIGFNGILAKEKLVEPDLENFLSENGVIIMAEKEVRLQPLKNFEAVHENAKPKNGNSEGIIQYENGRLSRAVGTF